MVIHILLRTNEKPQTAYSDDGTIIIIIIITHEKGRKKEKARERST